MLNSYQILTFGDWPYPDKPSYIFTKRALTSDRDDVNFVSGSVEQFMQNIQKKGFKKLWLVGGAELLIADFMRHKLVDEYIITLIPTILGEGIPLFKHTISEHDLGLRVEAGAQNDSIRGSRCYMMAIHLRRKNA